MPPHCIPDSLLTVANLLLNLILTNAPTDNLDAKTIEPAGQFILKKTLYVLMFLA